MSSVLQVDLPWLLLRTKLVQEDDKGILYRTMFDNYILDNSKFQMVGTDCATAFTYNESDSF